MAARFFLNFEGRASIRGSPLTAALTFLVSASRGKISTEID
jgi:hypothetical protein